MRNWRRSPARWDHRDAEIVLRLKRRDLGPAASVFAMPVKTLSIFVDESGRFLHPDEESRFYILGLVLHDQSHDIGPLCERLNHDWSAMGLSGHCFHAGPLIRKEKGYAILNREFRARIFARMAAFVRKADIRCRCLVVDKHFVSSSGQIVEELRRQLANFLRYIQEHFDSFDRIKVYYDCGQTPVTNLLHGTFDAGQRIPVEFAQAVRPERYKLFQVADYICTVKLIDEKLRHGIPMTESEDRFFGGPRKFRRNILKAIQAKTI